MAGSDSLSALGSVAYFCVPPNPKLLAYWDTVEDRLYKLRNCLTLDGEYSPLALYDPPLDAGALVAAAAAGASGAELAFSAARPHYRFRVMVQKALGITASVRALGGALLSALEKRDAEQLALLRSTHEQSLLGVLRATKERAITEATEALQALRGQRDNAEARRVFYEELIEVDRLPKEQAQEKLLQASQVFSALALAGVPLQALTSIIPTLNAGGTGGTAWVNITGSFGGPQISGLVGLLNSSLSQAGGIAAAQAGLKGLQASWERRKEQWEHQLSQTEGELQVLDFQILAAEARLAAAETALSAHDQQLTQAQEIEAFYTSKFGSEQLHDWMVTQVTTLYFQAYQLAYTAAKKAEVCWQEELASSTSFVGANHYDDLRKGLLAGEGLQFDLERMDAAYLDEHARELELTRHISLQRLDLMALVRLRATGECWFDVPEALFDLDCPGHYRRRLVSVGVSVACVTGSGGQVNADLTLQRSFVRSDPAGTLDEETGLTPAVIVTSTGEQDQGLFQPDLGDPRYLPFEGRGAVSEWSLRFSNPDYPQLDRDSVTDVVLHVRYRAQAGDDTFRDSVVNGLPTALDGLVGGYGGAPGSGSTGRTVVALSARRDVPDAWYQAHDVGGTTLSFGLGADWLPYALTGRTVTVKQVHVVTVGAQPSPSSLTVTVPSGGTAEPALSFSEWPAAGSGAWLGSTAEPLATPPTGWPADLDLDLSSGDFSAFDDVVVVLELEVT